MFTGLIREIGTITSVRPTATGRDLAVRCPLLAAEALTGDSIAANGVCLTVTALTADGYTCHAGIETLSRSTAGSWQPGRRVNLEAALRAGDRLGGHFVQGHVDCVGRCTARQALGETVAFEFSLPPDYAAFLAEKGSVAVDGISLTVTRLNQGVFGVAVIPHTLAETTLQDIQPGQHVNIEVDILAKYVHRALGRGKAGITAEFLAEHGYM
jgi:riboflavin synthase